MILAGNTYSKGKYGNRDFYQPGNCDDILHWTGLWILRRWSDEETDSRVAHAIKSTEFNHLNLKQRWTELWEAYEFMTNDFKEWWHHGTYPHLVHEGWPNDGSESTVQEHLRLARQYIKDYEMLSVWDPENFTDAMPKEIQKRVKESLKVIRDINSQGWHWDEKERNNAQIGARNDV